MRLAGILRFHHNYRKLKHMRRLLRPLLAMLLGLALLALLVLLLSPAARQLAPSWLYYDLVVRQIAPPPAGVEQYVLARGQDFCSIGRDSECGGFRLVNARRLSSSGRGCV